MRTKKSYTKNDLQIGSTAKISKTDEIFTHTHVVQFDRALTQAERTLFISVLTGFYHTVHFSQQFGGGLVAEPVVEFVAPDTAHYTLRQTVMNGTWKDLLLAILTNFGREVVPIRQHDDSQVFTPTYIVADA